MTIPSLFSPITMGRITLPNRIVMAPLTRSRATEDGNVKDMHAVYYSQRASAGLIVSEATWVAPSGCGFALTPGICSPSHVDRWKKVTDAVHASHGRIFLQLWHVGRCSHPDLQPGGGLPVAPSALDPGIRVYTLGGFKPAPVPRALKLQELPGIVEQFQCAAENARLAGFDGVEIHGANGYLIDQFLCDESNHREDEYGGPVGNRMRLPLEIVDAVIGVWGADRVGIRLSPTSYLKNCGDSNPEALFSCFVRALSDRNLAYIHVIEGTAYAERDPCEFKAWSLKQRFRGLYIGNNGYTREMAIQRVEHGQADLVSFGRLFIGNPDLVARLAKNAPLTWADKATYYGGDDGGYTDFVESER